MKVGSSTVHNQQFVLSALTPAYLRLPSLGALREGTSIIRHRLGRLKSPCKSAKFSCTLSLAKSLDMQG
jgi:hypothetical protein